MVQKVEIHGITRYIFVSSDWMRFGRFIASGVIQFNLTNGVIVLKNKLEIKSIQAKNAVIEINGDTLRC